MADSIYIMILIMKQLMREIYVVVLKGSNACKQKSERNDMGFEVFDCLASIKIVNHVHVHV